MAGTTAVSGGKSAVKSEARKVRDNFNLLVDDVEALRNYFDYLTRDRVIYGDNATVAAGLSVDANAQDFETDNAILIRHKGILYPVAAVGAFDWSASGTCAGDTVAQSGAGAFWVFANPAGTLDVESNLAAQNYASEIAAIAAWAVATNTLPPGSDDVPIGLITVVEGGSGVWTAGTDSITAETEVYYSFLDLPAVEVPMASFALDAAAATFTYGAAIVRLGTGTRVSMTGKAHATLSGSNVADGDVGAWLFYGLADDVEFAQQLDNDYGTLAEAQAGVRDHNKNPLLPLLGVIYVQNASGAAFVPGTTHLDAPGITATFVTSVAPRSPVDTFADLLAAKVNP